MINEIGTWSDIDYKNSLYAWWCLDNYMIQNLSIYQSTQKAFADFLEVFGGQQE